MLIDIQGDLFEASGPAFGHGVNVYGVMSAGVASIVRNDYPEAYDVYRTACSADELQPGMIQPVLCLRPSSLPGGKGVWVLNMATQDRPGSHAQLEWVESATREALRFCHSNGYEHLNIPRLGCGIGGLDYESQVRPLFKKVAEEFPLVELRVYFID